MLVAMDSDILHGPLLQAPGAWARIFPTVYDPFLWLGERMGVGALRAELLRQTSGRTVEIGSGTGLNASHYPDGLEDLVFTEPDPGMRSRLRERLDRAGSSAQALDAYAERLPFADGSIDTVVATFVLCTVARPELALREIRRVLRPDGQFLFLEHVRSDSPRLAGWQERLAEPWRRFGNGCRCNRAITDLIGAQGLQIDDLRHASWRAMPPIVRPLVAGRAVPSELS